MVSPVCASEKRRRTTLYSACSSWSSRGPLSSSKSSGEDTAEAMRL